MLTLGIIQGYKVPERLRVTYSATKGLRGEV